MSFVVGAVIVACLFLISAAALIWKLASSIRVHSVDPAWLKNFSISSYRPMERLLDEDDVQFLKQQPGYEPGMEQRLRSDRHRIFRLYLKSVGRDFNRLHHALRLMALQAPEDRPDLAAALIKQKLIFVVSLAAIHVRLELYRFGFSGVDVRGLVSTLERMQQELQAMMSSAAVSAGAA